MNKGRHYAMVMWQLQQNKEAIKAKAKALRAEGLTVNIRDRGGLQQQVDVTDARGHLWLSTTYYVDRCSWVVGELDRALEIYRRCGAQVG